MNQVPAQAEFVKYLTVDVDSAGQRLDNFLMRHLKGVPKTHIYRIIRSGEVRVNKGRAAADTRIQAGDVLRLPPMRVSEKVELKAHNPAPAREFPILWEDDYLIAIDKPAGVAVHGGSGVSFGVIEQIRHARPDARFLELVHRLDRETSGILLIAKKRSALKHLQDQFRERATGKTYLALALGHWPDKLKVIDKALHKFLVAGGMVGEGERRVKVVANDDPDGLRSITLVKVLHRWSLDTAAATTSVENELATEKSQVSVTQPVSLLAVTIKTGRTHQIRVHLASEGMPIAGDDKYGDFEVNKALVKAKHLKRMFLHAWRLQVTHPGTGKQLKLEVMLPPELLQMLPSAWETLNQNQH